MKNLHIFEGRSVIIGFCTTHKIPFIPHPYGMRSERNGFSHGLKKCPLDTFYTSVRTGAVLSNPNTKKIQATTNVVTGILVGVSGFELCYFGLFDIFRTFICANIPFCSKYSITSNYVFCSYPLKGFSKGKNKGKFLMGTCFLQNHVYTNK